MFSQQTLLKRAITILGVGMMILASILPMLLPKSADAAQLTDRSITLGSSVVSATTNYAVSFETGSATSILGIVVDFCTDSPLIGSACTQTNGVTGIPTSGTVTVNGTAFTVASAGGTRLILSDATGLTGLSAGTAVTFNFAATNPSTLNTFYARIITTSTTGAATGYTPTNGTATAGYIDYGGIALSTARQLTVNARVQEQLEFCVSAIDGTIDTNGEMPADCTAMPSDTEVNLGVIDNTLPVAGTKGISPVPAANGGNDKNGGVMVRTNAVNGAVVSYRAAQETSSGALKVPGQTCSAPAQTDQCFNSAAALHDFSASGEAFGMAVSQTLESGTTDNLTSVLNYTNATADPAVGFTWDDTGTAVTFLNTTTTVTDYELAVLRFAARAAATTPTGAYTVTSTYIATATF